MINNQNLVILVDQNDTPIGTEEKIKAHQEGKLHRAFSVFTFNSEGKMLIHQRALGKYHTGGQWTNTCCSHPRPGEETEAAAHRRLVEEMGFDCDLQKAFSFVYAVKFENGLSEHEFDHVFVGWSDAVPKPDPEEVADFKWVDCAQLLEDIKNNPDNYTYWFKVAVERVVDFVNKSH